MCTRNDDHVCHCMGVRHNNGHSCLLLFFVCFFGHFCANVLHSGKHPIIAGVVKDWSFHLHNYGVPSYTKLWVFQNVCVKNKTKTG